MDTRRDPDTRMQRAKPFKATYASLGLSVTDVGKLLHVTPRTLHNWIAGRCDIPYPDAMLLQIELDLAGVVGAEKRQRDAWWTWPMNTGRVIEHKVTAPAWWAAMKRRALALAKAVKAACMAVF